MESYVERRKRKGGAAVNRIRSSQRQVLRKCNIGGEDERQVREQLSQKDQIKVATRSHLCKEIQITDEVIPTVHERENNAAMQIPSRTLTLRQR